LLRESARDIAVGCDLHRNDQRAETRLSSHGLVLSR